VGTAIADTKKKKSRWFVFAAETMFYAMIAVFLVCIFLFASTGSSTPFTVLGVSAMHMPPASMQSEIPQDSLIITVRVNEGSLNIGDDIAFFMTPEFVVVSKIVGVRENFTDAGTGGRSFITQGFDETYSDMMGIEHANIIGKVIFNSAGLGSALLFARQNVFLSIALSALIIWFFTALRGFVSSPEAFLGNRKSLRHKK
jgi:hypothetical protein